MNNILTSGFIVFSLILCSCNKDTSSEDKSRGNIEQNISNENDLNEGPAPDFNVTSIENKSIRLSDYKGKVVIVDFWATWCPPCRRGIPDLIDIQKEYGSDVVVIGISMDTDSKNDVVPFVKENGINYHVGYANPEVVQAYGGIESIPTSFVINKNGKIVDKHEGLVPKSDFTNVLNKLLHKS